MHEPASRLRAAMPTVAIVAPTEGLSHGPHGGAPWVPMRQRPRGRAHCAKRSRCRALAAPRVEVEPPSTASTRHQFGRASRKTSKIHARKPPFRTRFRAKTPRSGVDLHIPIEKSRRTRPFPGIDPKTGFSPLLIDAAHARPYPPTSATLRSDSGCALAAASA